MNRLNSSAEYVYYYIYPVHDNNIILCVHYYTASDSFIGEDQIIYFKSIQNDAFFYKKLIFIVSICKFFNFIFS